MNLVEFLTPKMLDNGSKLIRLGRAKDGGYVLPEYVVHDVDVCYTYGVGSETSFEHQFNMLTTKPCRLFDHTVSFHYDSTWTSDCTFKRQGLGSTINPDLETFRVHRNTYGDNDKRVMLKVDIEGGEYAYFGDNGVFKGETDNVGCLLIEFHTVKSAINQFIDVCSTLQELGFVVVHTHGNNNQNTFVYDGYTLANVIELTLVQSSIYGASVPTPHTYPIAGLDYPNCMSCGDDLKFSFLP